MHNWFVYPDFTQASVAAAKFLENKIRSFISINNVCHIALPGGKSPLGCLSHLANADLPWEKTHWYLGDERCYPKGHPERNDVMLQQVLWSRLADTNIYLTKAELGAEKAAADYRVVINRLERLDIAYLGLGEDGHTASLFPDNAALQDTRSVVPVFNSPKEPSKRISLSIDMLKNARCRMVLTPARSKENIIKKIRDGEPLPVNSIGNINWYTEQAAIK